MAVNETFTKPCYILHTETKFPGTGLNIHGQYLTTKTLKCFRLILMAIHYKI